MNVTVFDVWGATPFAVFAWVTLFVPLASMKRRLDVVEEKLRRLLELPLIIEQFKKLEAVNG